MSLQIGGFQKLSLIDYPGKVAAVIFTQGCNFRCPFCHNRELVIPAEFREAIPESEVTSFLVQRQDKLQGVVVTGGEPTIQPDLIPFLRQIKALGYLIKLDTNASRPDVIQALLAEDLVDFFAIDIKASWDRYQELAGIDVHVPDLRRSIELVIRSGKDHMFRTTIVKPLFSIEDFSAIAPVVAGSRRYILQEFIPRPNVLDPTLLDKRHYTDEEVVELKARWERPVRQFDV